MMSSLPWSYRWLGLLPLGLQGAVCPLQTACGQEVTSTNEELGLRHWKAIFGDAPMRMKSRLEDFVVDGSGVKVFVYKLHRQFNRDAMQWAELSANESGSNCDYMLSPCTETSWNDKYTTLRQWGAEVLFLEKVLSARRDVLTDDASKADIFVVPYFAALGCRMPRWNGHACSMPHGPDHNQLFEALKHYTERTAHRHVFLASNDAHSAPLVLQMQPVVLTVGPIMSGSRAVIAPPSNVDVEIQPTAVAGKDLAGGRDMRIWHGASSNNVVRLALELQLKAAKRSLPKAVADSIVLKTMIRGDGSGFASMGAQSSPAGFVSLMRQSQLCVCPPAENTAAGTKRFFDILVSGCVPIVIAFRSAAPHVGESWWRHGGPPLAWSLPFWGDIDWPSMVVSVPFEVVNASQFVPYVLSIPSELIEAKRRNLLRVRNSFVFDFDATVPDAFTLLFRKVVRSVREQNELVSSGRSHHCCLATPRHLLVRLMPWTKLGTHDKWWQHGWGELHCKLVSSPCGDDPQYSRFDRRISRRDSLSVEIWRDAEFSPATLASDRQIKAAQFEYCQLSPATRACHTWPRNGRKVVPVEGCPFRGLPPVPEACRVVPEPSDAALPKATFLWPLSASPTDQDVKELSRLVGGLAHYGLSALRIIEVTERRPATWASVIIEHILVALAAAATFSATSQGNSSHNFWWLLPDFSMAKQTVHARQIRVVTKANEHRDMMVLAVRKGWLYDTIVKPGKFLRGNTLMDNSYFDVGSGPLPAADSEVPTLIEVRFKIIQRVPLIKWRKLLAMQHKDPWDTWHGIYELLLSEASPKNVRWIHGGWYHRDAIAKT
eukprot:TRINITY_DN33649_c0_g1_i2.p1 TRINITY_DN33649_c0_g1~~TRINITY_DN33649_c0_g1_i2.p1  ORF type:complete len:830 (+),score=102.13 TRINITY_DN33649_c0_g1_i2:121-2610(+)